MVGETARLDGPVCVGPAGTPPRRRLSGLEQPERFALPTAGSAATIKLGARGASSGRPPPREDASGQPATTYSYDRAGRLTGLSRGAQTVAMGYDSAGRRQTTTLPNAITRTDRYDAASRLSSIVYRRGAQTLGDLNYEYDSAGRRTAQWGTLAKTALPEEMSSATYDQANRQTERGGVAQAHDAEGNLTSDGENDYAWNARGELASLEGPECSASFRYDPFGRRSQKTVGGGLLQGQRTDYLHDGHNLVQEQRGGKATDLLQGGIDEIFARTKGAQTDTFLRDGLGSTAALAGGSEAPQTNYRYDPFGGSTEEGAPADNAWRFTGREDDQTGLLHYRARYMSPGSGRFASEDPIGLAGGDANLYAYVGGDPVNGVDPSGLSPLSLEDPLSPNNLTPGGPLNTACRKSPCGADSSAENSSDPAMDALHIGLGIWGIADSAIFFTGTAALTPVCFTGVSVAPVVGQVAGYPACAALTAGGLLAGGLAFAEGIDQFSKVGK